MKGLGRYFFVLVIIVTSINSLFASEFSENENLNVEQQTSSITINGTTTDVSCNGTKTGSINLSVSGGTPPYTYSWSNGAITSNISNLSGGTYTVTVKDGSNATQTASFTIAEPAPINISGSTIYSLCNGQSAQTNLTVSGGVSPYTYAWSTGENTSNITVTTSSSSYNLHLTDANDCSFDTAVFVNALPNPSVTTTSNFASICAGSSTSLSSSVSGGTYPYTYSWSPSSSLSSTIVSNPIASPTTNTTYSLTVTDSKGCSNTSPSTVLVTINSLPVVNAGKDTLICFGTNANIGSAAKAGETYNWTSNPADANLNPGISLQTVSPSATTSYMLGVTDNNGCVNSDTVIVSIHTQVNPIITRIGDSLISSGSGAFTVTWLKNGNYDMDTPYNYENNVRLYNPGAYQVISTDNYGCKDTSAIFNVDNKKVGGMIRTGNNQGLVNTAVYLFSIYHYPNTDSLIVDSMVYTDATGYFKFSSCLTNVHVAVFPDKNANPDLVPTYYPGALVFQDAQKIDVSSDIDSLNFTVLSGVNPGGPGLFYGTIDELSPGAKIAALKIASAGAPYIRIILIDNSGNPVEYTYTDVSGNFQFTNLSYGTYKVWIDMPDIDNSLAPEITLSSANPSITNSQFNLHSTYLEKVSVVSGVASSTSLSSFELYPNPAKEFFMLNSGTIGNINYSLINSTGKIVKEGTTLCPVRIPITDLERGVYILRTLSEDRITINKIVLE